MATTLAEKLTNIKVLARINPNSSSPKYSTAEITAIANLCDRDFARETYCTRATFTQDIVASTQEYAANTGDYSPLKVYEVWDVSGSHSNWIKPKNSRLALSRSDGFQKFTTTGTPSLYWLEYNGTAWRVNLYPVPNTASTNGLTILSSFLPPLMTASVACGLPDEYADIPDYKTAAILAASDKDGTLASQLMAEYETLKLGAMDQIADRDYIDSAEFPEDKPEYPVYGSDTYAN